MAEVAAKFTADISGYKSAMSRMSSSTTSATKSVSSLGSKVSNAMKKVGKVTMGAGAATTAMGVSALKSYGTFQQSLNKAAIVAGGTSKDIGELADMANKMGADLPLSAQDAADAMVSMAQDGASIKTITKEFPAIAEAATATGADLQTTAGTVQQAMNIWGKSLKSPAQAAAILTQTANLSNASVEEMSGAIANIGGVASQAKFGMGDMTEAIGLLTNKGFTARRASRNLAHAIIQMEAPSKSAKTEMKALGLSFTDAQGKMKPFPTILKEVADATDGMSASEKTAALKAMFNTAGMQAMLPLLDSVNDKSENTATSWDAYAKAQDGASSSAATANKFLKDQAKDMQRNVGSKIEQVGGNWESLRNKSMASESTITGGMIDMINKTLIWSSESNSGISKVIRGFIGLSPVIGPAVTAMGGFIFSAGKIIGVASGAAKGLVRLGTGALGAANGVKNILKVVSLTNPWVLIIAAIAAVVAALVYFFTKTKTGQEIWKKFTEMLSSLWTTIATTAVNVWTTIATFFTTIWTNIVTVAKTVWTTISTFLTTIWTAISTVATTVWTTISTFLTTLWTGIVTTATTIWTGLSTFFSSLWSGISSIISGAWELIKSIVLGAILIVLDLVTGNFTALKKDISLIWNGIKSGLASIWNGIKSVATTVFKTIKNGIVNIWNGIKSVTSSVWNGIKSFLSGLWNGIKSLASSTWNGLKSAISNAWNGIKSTTSSVWNGIKSFISSTWSGIKSTASNAANAMGSSIRSAWNGIRSFASSLWNGVKSTIQGAMSFNLFDAGRAIMDSFFSGLQAAWGKVQSFVGGIASWVRKHKGPISYDAKLLIPAGNAMMNGLNSGLMNSFSNVQSNVSSMADKLADSINSVAGDIKTGDLSMQAASYQGGSIDQNIDSDNWVKPNIYVQNNVDKNGINSMVKEADANDAAVGSYFRPIGG